MCVMCGMRCVWGFGVYVGCMGGVIYGTMVCVCLWHVGCVVCVACGIKYVWCMCVWCVCVVYVWCVIYGVCILCVCICSMWDMWCV